MCKGSNADNTIRACLYIQGGFDEEENSRRAMKRGYIARRPVRKLRSFGASRAKPETNIGFNPLHPVRYEPPHASAASQKFL